MVVQLTDKEIEEIDRRLQEHISGHRGSWDYSSFVCDDECRKICLGIIINDILREREESNGAGTTIRDSGSMGSHGPGSMS